MEKNIDYEFLEDTKKLKKYLSYDLMKDTYYTLHDIRNIKFYVKLLVKLLETGKRF